MEGSGAARELRGGLGSGYAAVDMALGVANLAVADGDVTRSAGAIPSKKRRRSGGPARGLLSFLSLLRGFLLNVIKGN